jgi:hypothetical protein
MEVVNRKNLLRDFMTRMQSVESKETLHDSELINFCSLLSEIRMKTLLVL